MASLANQTISSTYDGLIKTSSDNAVPVSGVQALEDGSGNALALSVGRSGNGVTISGNLAVDTNTLYVDAANNRVGIGTSSLSEKAEIYGNLRLGNATANAELSFGNQSASTAWKQASISAVDISGAGGALSFKTKVADSNFATAPTERMRIDSSGNVGIGEQNPDSNNAGVDRVLQITSTRPSIRIKSSYSPSGADCEIVSETDGAMVLRNYYASGNIQFITNGSERMRIDSSGRVGIGTSSPDAKLSLYDATEDVSINVNTGTGGSYPKKTGISFGANSTSLGGDLEFRGGAGIQAINTAISGNPTDLLFWTTVGGSPAERMRIDSSGHLTIGKSNYDPRLYMTSTGGNGINERFYIDGFADGGGAGYGGGFRIHTRNTVNVFEERMRIDSSGRVGIGKSSPDGLLNLKHTSSSGAVANDASAYALTLDFAGNTNDFGRHIAIRDTNGAAVASMGGIDYGASGATGLYFATGDVNSITERMRITSGGEVLIGTQSTPDGTSAYGSSFSAESNNRMVLRLATSSINQYSVARFYNPNGQVGEIKTQNFSTLYVTSSDYRLKENVVEMTGALDRVDTLKPSRFNFIGDEKTVDGFLAHEVQDIVPEAITGEKDAVDEEGNPIYQGIDQSKIVPLLVGAIKELRAEVESLKSQLS